MCDHCLKKNDFSGFRQIILYFVLSTWTRIEYRIKSSMFFRLTIYTPFFLRKQVGFFSKFVRFWQVSTVYKIFYNFMRITVFAIFLFHWICLLRLGLSIKSGEKNNTTRLSLVHATLWGGESQLVFLSAIR